MAVTEEQYFADIKTQKAVVMSIINIGELSKGYSDTFIEDHKTISWRQIQAMRNIAAHKYEIVNPTRVWDTIRISIPQPEQAIK